MKAVQDWLIAVGHAVQVAWERIDPKLKYTVLSAAVTWALAKYAIDLDPDVAALVSAFVASVAGYAVPNQATLLRTDQETGNAVLPADVPADRPPTPMEDES